MFFCEECRQRNNWPGLWPSSRGPCEVCGKTRDCYDVSSSRLWPVDVEGKDLGGRQAKREAKQLFLKEKGVK